MSRSGAIRQSIGPARARLNTNVAAARQLLAKAIPETALELQRLVDDIGELLAKIDKGIRGITERDGQWQTMILQLPADDVPDEEALYAKTALDQPGGHLLLIEEANDVVCGLDRRRLEATRFMDRAPVVGDVAGGDGNVAAASRSMTAKLPKLNMPTFDGNYFEWESFWSIFEANVDQQKMSATEKFSYLRGQLSGVALQAIDGIVVNNQNYTSAIAILRDRFERSSHQLVGNLYSQLKRLPPATDGVSGLTLTYDSCEKIFRQLKNAGEDTDANRSLVLDVLGKYPKSVVRDLLRHHNVGTHSSLSEVRTSICNHIRQYEGLVEFLDDLDPFDNNIFRKSLVVSRGGKQEGLQGRSPREESAKFPSSTSALIATTNNRSGGTTGVTSSAPPQRPCVFCDGAHFNADCGKYVTALQRIQKLRELGLCFRCLKSGHMSTKCQAACRIRCFLCKAMGVHPTPLCPERFGESRPVTSVNSGSAPCTGKPSTVTMVTEPTILSQAPVDASLLVGNRQAMLLTAVATARDVVTGKEVSVRILFDTGSHRTFITDAKVKELQLATHDTEPLNVAVFGSTRSVSMSTSRVSFDLLQRDGSVRTIEAHTTPLITDCPIAAGRLPSEDIRMIQSMKETLADDCESTNGSIDVLVGSDYFWELMCGQRLRLPSGLFIVPSTLGLLLGGRYDGDPAEEEPPPTALVCLTETFSRIPLYGGLLAVTNKATPPYPDIDEYWSLETVGITDNPINNDDDEAIRQFNDSVYYEDGRYHVKWPMKPNAVNLPVNKALAGGRLKSQMKKLKAGDTGIAQKYQDVINHQLENNIIEVVPEDELKPSSSGNLVHYLPHHAVVKPGSATTKVRVVYDASSKTRKDDPSLNECLYRGPVILPELCAVLIRFRLNRIAIVADVEKAFLQICLQPSDRDVTRFLHVKDPDEPVSDDNMQHYRFCRVPFGVVSSPFMLGAVLQYHLKLDDHWVAKKIADNIYVDNAISGTDTLGSAIEFYGQAKRIFRAAGMNLQEWGSNSSQMMDEIPTADHAKQRQMKVLGLHWDCETDTLRISGDTSVRTFTKRGVLHAVASIFDPLGLFQPVLIRCKRFLQRLWEDNRAWDELISEDDKSELQELMDDTSALFNVTIPRNPCVINVGSHTLVEVVVFSDASQMAYAGAVYLRVWDDQTDTWSSNLVFSKCRLAPKKRSGVTVTLPRLELLGLVIATRAGQFVRNALVELGSIPPITVFSDSTCVLQWLRSPKPLSVFVENRVRELNNVPRCEFRYVNTSENPADYSTRGKTVSEIRASTSWWLGPPWLREPRDKWPESACDPRLKSGWGEEAEVEARKTSGPVFHTLVAGEGAVPACWTSPFGIINTDFSSFVRLQRVTAWCLKFLKLKLGEALSQRARDVDPELSEMLNGVTMEKFLTSSDLAASKSLWIRSIQTERYAEVKNSIGRERVHSLVRQLGISVDPTGVLRCRGRFEHADLPPEALEPKLLPKDHHVTDLIIRDMHGRMLHSGVGHTLSQLRREYWIPQGRMAVRKVLSKCVLCRRHRGGSFVLPNMPPWPRERLARSSPFRFTGLDYLGPINVRVGELEKKMWVCLFTCLAVRAVHLEWVSDCTAKEFLDCVIRFVARRGTPEQIISDNAPQFRATKSVFDKLWHATLRDDSVRSYASNNAIEWKFTTELAPWQGGVYERLVGLVKRALKVGIGRRLLQWEELITIVAEVEAITNSRPITYVYSDLDSGFTLRPIDFITDLSPGMPHTGPKLDTNNLGVAGKDLVRYWKHKQRRLTLIWEFWYNEYLLSLRERGQTQHKGRRNDVKSSPDIDEVVLVKDTNVPRGAWKLGRVIGVIAGADGAVRTVEVRLPNNVIIRRSVSHLYPLEIGTVRCGDDGLTADAAAGDTGDDNTETDFDGFTEQEVDDVTRQVAAQNFGQYHRPAIEEGLTVAGLGLCFSCKH